MRGRSNYDFWHRLALALIVLAANVCAPFRTTLGRQLLDGVRHNVGTRSVVRVRVVSPSGASQGFRVVTGLGRGNPEGSAPAPRVLTSFVHSLVLPSRPHQEVAAPGVARPHPFLRC
jgi:hypothetical protein